MEAFHEADIQFHRAICELCQNELLFMIYDAVESLMDDVTRQNVERSVRSTSNFDLVLSHHREMLESLQDRDMERFTKAQMDSRERSLRYYASSQQES